MHAARRLAIFITAIALAFLPAQMAEAQSCPASCKQPPPPTGPGGDTPDDNVSSASPVRVAPTLPEPSSRATYVKAGTAVLVNGFWDKTLGVLQAFGVEAVT